MTATSNSFKGETARSKGTLYGILAGKLFDSRERRLRYNQVIMIDRELGVILDVVNHDEFQRQENGEIELLDFRQWTLVPGFIDVHVHRMSFCFLDRDD